jgi:hypothetical protein
MDAQLVEPVEARAALSGPAFGGAETDALGECACDEAIPTAPMSETL